MTEFIWWKYILYGFVGGGAAFLSGYLGVGGGVILVPLFYFILSHSIGSFQAGHIAVATSLFVILFNSLTSFLTHYFRGNVDLRRGLEMAAGGIPGVAAGLYLNGWLGGASIIKLFAVFEVIVAIYLWMGRKGEEDLSEIVTKGTLKKHAAVGFAAGVISAFFGVGGGIVAVPLQLIALNSTIHTAIGTSSFLIFLNAVSGTIGYAWTHMIHYSLGVPVAAFSVTFSFAGARLTARSSPEWLRKMFSLLLIVLASLLFLRS